MLLFPWPFSQFQSAKMAAEDPLKAAGVYEEMKDAIIGAEQAVQQASEAADNASAAVSPPPNGLYSFRYTKWDKC